MAAIHPIVASNTDRNRSDRSNNTITIRDTVIRNEPVSLQRVGKSKTLCWKPEEFSTN